MIRSKFVDIADLPYLLASWLQSSTELLFCKDNTIIQSLKLSQRLTWWRWFQFFQVCYLPWPAIMWVRLCYDCWALVCCAIMETGPTVHVNSESSSWMMDPAANLSVQNNLKKVLTYFIESQNCVRNDCYLEKIQTHLKSTGTLSLYSHRHNSLLSLNFVDDLEILTLGTTWLKALLAKEVRPHPSILAFGIKFATTACRKRPELLQDVLDSGTAETLLELPMSSPLIEIAFIGFMRQVITTKQGLIWFSTRKGWNFVISYASQSNTIFTLREIANFLHDYLRAVQDIRELCLTVVGDLIRPLHENIWIKPNLIIDIDDSEAKGVIMKMMRIVEFLYLKIFETPDLGYIPYNIFKLQVSGLPIF